MKPSLAERLDAFLWQHPRLHALAMAALVGGIFLACLYLIFKPEDGFRVP